MGGGPSPEVNAANEHASYMRGWTDGVRATAMRAGFTTHSVEPIRRGYIEGYTAGRADRARAYFTATVRIGHTPSVLR